MRRKYENNQFTAAMDTIKAVTFGTPNIVLHRREMLDATPPFQALQNSIVRGHLDTMLLKLLAEGTYRVFYENGSAHVPKKIFQERLTNGELKIKPKSASVAGLQFADLIASPSYRCLICEKTGVLMTGRFGQDVEAICEKTNTSDDPLIGEISGWGKKWLP